MARDDYQKRLERHLVAYKKRCLGVLDDGEFVFNKQRYPKPHILPVEVQWLNIPEPYRAEIQSFVSISNRIKLHQYFHHLNSSQAFALALFLPFLWHARHELVCALGGTDIDEWELERIPEPRENTNVDVWWRAADGAETYCEVKLSEREFGSATDDARHRRKLNDIYGPVLRGQIDDGLLEPTEFFANYQILRNLWLAARPGHERDRVVFVFPGANVGIGAQLAAVLAEVAAALRERVAVVHVERLLETLAADTSPNSLGWYAGLLRDKYVPE